MFRPLAWVLALVVVAVSVLLIVVPRVSPDRPTPDVDAVLAQDASRGATEVELTSDSEADARPEAGRADAIASGTQAAGLGIPDGAIEVSVVRDEDGSPIEGAEVVIAPHGPWDHIPALATRDDGTVRQSGLRLGSWVVRATSPRRAERVEFVSLSSESSQASVNLRLQHAALVRDVHVRIVDAQGQLATPQTPGIDAPITSLLGVALAPQCQRPGSRMSDNHSATRVSSESVPDGLHWKIPLRDDRTAFIHLLLAERVVSAHEVSAGQDLVEFLAQDLAAATSACDVLVLDTADDAPVVGAKVVFHFGNRKWTRTSDEEGRVGFGLVPLGETTLTVDAPKYASLRQNVQIPLSAPLVLRLGAPRRIHGIVVDGSGEPIENVPLILQSEDEAKLRMGTSYTFGAKSGPDGRFEYGSLWHETYVVGAGWPPVPPVPAGADRSETGRQPPLMTPQEAVVTERVDLRAGDALGVVLRVDRKKP